MNSDQALGQLAERCGIIASYWNIEGQEHIASPETQRALLRANGVMVDNDAMVHEVLAHIDATNSARRIPEELIIQSNLKHELSVDCSGHWRIHCTDTNKIVAEGQARGQITLPPLQSGIYELMVTSQDKSESSTLLVAPERTPMIADVTGRAQHWGLNAALYGIRSERSRGLGDFEDLALLGEILAECGASFLGINPVHAIGWMANEVVSPYSPSHRAMLNTSHIALDRIPGFDPSTIAQALQTADVGNQNADRSPTIDYQACKRIHDEGLIELFNLFKGNLNSGELAAFDQSRSTCDDSLDEFTLYEAISECHGEDWRHWPSDLARKDPLALQNFKDSAAERIEFHQWLQWIAQGQLKDAHTRSKCAGLSMGLYLDLAVGSRRGGAESWCDQHVIAQDVSIGAPPDHLSPEGQNWQLAALAPHKLKAEKYASLQRVLRATMRHAGVVRIDHVLGINRSFWIPDDGSPGAYITQPFDSLVALIKIEAEKARTVVIGEDLGLVPGGFRERIRSQGFYGYSVLQFDKDESGALRDPSETDQQVLACFGTHDTPTLQGFSVGRDIDWWKNLGWIDEDMSAHAHSVRSKDVARLTAMTSNSNTEDNVPLSAAIHSALAQSPAAMVSIQLDDVLCQLDAQNIPGTILEHPNWSRQYTTPIEELTAHPGLPEITNIMQRAGRCTTNSTD